MFSTERWSYCWIAKIRIQANGWRVTSPCKPKKNYARELYVYSRSRAGTNLNIFSKTCEAYKTGSEPLIMPKWSLIFVHVDSRQQVVNMYSRDHMANALYI